MGKVTGFTFIVGIHTTRHPGIILVIDVGLTMHPTSIDNGAVQTEHLIHSDWRCREGLALKSFLAASSIVSCAFGICILKCELMILTWAPMNLSHSLCWV